MAKHPLKQTNKLERSPAQVSALSFINTFRRSREQMLATATSVLGKLY